MEIWMTLVPVTAFLLVVTVFVLKRLFSDNSEVSWEQHLGHSHGTGLEHDEKLRRWNEAGDRLDLDRVDNYPREQLRLEGTVDGRDVVIRREQVLGSPAVRYEVSARELMPEGFAMVPQDVPGFVDRLFDREDIIVGNESLDRRYVFHGVDEEDVKSFVWTEGVEGHLLEFGGMPRGWLIREGRVRGIEVGPIPDPRRVERRVRRALAWIEKLRAIVTGAEEASADRSERAEREWEAPS